MKLIYLILCFVASGSCLNSCNKDNSSAPPLIERTCKGTIIFLPNPPTGEEPTLPGMILGLKTFSVDYILTCEGAWLFDGLISIDSKKYNLDAGDEVIVTGYASKKGDYSTQEYIELEIKKIEILSTN